MQEVQPNQQILNPQNTAPVSQPVQNPAPLAHSGEENTFADLEATSSKFFVLITKAISIGLTLQGLWHLYESVYFILIEATQMSQQLTIGEITRDEIIHLTAKAVAQFISATISFLLALHLIKMSEKTSQYLHILVGIGLFALNLVIIDFFRQIDADVLVSNVFNSILMYGMVLPQRLLELLP